MTAKEHFISALQTYVATFIFAVATELTMRGNIEWSVTFWSPLLLVGVRAIVKVLFQKYAPVALGGSKRG